MKKNFKIIISIIITAIICTSGTVYAVSYMAKDIKYKDKTVEDALNELYSNSSNKYFRYNKASKNVEVYNSKLNKWISIKHYNAGLPITGELYLNGNASIDFEKINRTTYSGITYTLNNDHIFINGNTNGGGGGIFTKEIFDVSDYSKLIVEGTIIKSNYNSEGVFVFLTENKYWGSSYEPSNTKILKNTKYNVGDFKQEIDISSLNGEYYIAVGLNQCDVKITKIELQ